jgi:hypothetical protein
VNSPTQPQGTRETVIIQEQQGCVSGCLTILLIVIAVGASIKYWYVTVPLLVLLVAGLIYQSQKSGVSVGSRFSALRANSASRRVARSIPTGVGSATVNERVVVVQKKGCSCCGTSCVLMVPLVSLSIFGLWEIFGTVVAVALWPTVFATAHATRHVTGNSKRIFI